MAERLHIDIETFSSESIKNGVYKYTESVDFEILLFSYAFGDEPVQDVSLATGELLPLKVWEALVSEAFDKHAHNAVFEVACIETHFGINLHIEQWFCTLVKAASCGLPLGLAKLSEVLNLGDQGKMSEGKRLIKYFCIPCKPTGANGGRLRNLPFHDTEKWALFMKYCNRDVSSERVVYKRLSRYSITSFEREMYLLDHKINRRGVKIDQSFAVRAYAVDMQYKAANIRRMREITDLDNPNSLPQLKSYLSEKTGKIVKSLAKDVLQDMVDKSEGEVREVLVLRQKVSKTSTAKYPKMLECMNEDGRIRGLFQFMGAIRTGRWAGRLVQLHNLKRNKVRDLAFWKELIRNNDRPTLQLFCNSVPDYISQLIRTAFIPEKGKVLCVADYSAIEARVIAWVAAEEWRLEVFRTHGKIYEASASMMFDIPVGLIKKDTEYEHYRDKGKVAELALGFQGGVNALIQMGGADMGLTETEMDDIKRKWRQKSPAIVQMWYSMQKSAIHAVKTKSAVSYRKGIVFDFDGHMMTMKLPSGRKLFYPKARIMGGKYGDKIVFFGQNKKGAWTWVDTYGGKLTENAVQAIARDLLAFSMRNLDRAGFDLIMHVHDENIAEVNVDGQEFALDEMCKIMSIQPDWAEGLPLGADGYLTEFYKKG